MNRVTVIRIGILTLVLFLLSCGGSDQDEAAEPAPPPPTPEETAALEEAVRYWKPRLNTCCWTRDRWGYAWYVNAADAFFKRNGFEKSKDNPWHFTKGSLTIKTGESWPHPERNGYQRFITIVVGPINERFPLEEPQ